MNSIKSWAIDTLVKKAAPEAIAYGLATVATLFTVHAGLLNKLGFFYDATTRIVSFHLGTFQEWVEGPGILAIGSLIVALVRHHTTQVISNNVQETPKV